MELKVDICFKASPIDFAYIQGVLARMEFLKFHSSCPNTGSGGELARCRVFIPAGYAPALPYVLGEIVTRYDIGSTLDGACNFGGSDNDHDDDHDDYRDEDNYEGSYE